MSQILRSDWLPERARWSHLACSGLPSVSCKKNFPESHIINPLLTKLVRSRCLDIGLVLSLQVYKHAKKELGQYPAILTSHLVNNPYVFYLCDSVNFARNRNIIHWWIGIKNGLHLEIWFKLTECKLWLRSMYCACGQIPLLSHCHFPSRYSLTEKLKNLLIR